VHKDVFTHCDENQQTNCQWYFHRTGKSYKGGTYKGLDITFGAANKGFGGILIRALKDLSTGAYIEGSCTCADKILSCAKASDIPSLVNMPSFNLDITKKGILCVKPAHKDIKKLTLYSSARVGLTLNKDDGDRPFYIMKPYRFMTYPQNVDKGKILLFLGLHHSGKDIDDIIKITGCKKATVTKYFDTYDAAKGSDKDTSKFQKKKKFNNDDLCKMYALVG